MLKNSSFEKITKEILSLNTSFLGFDSLDVCIVGLTPDGKIAYVNQPTCDMLGFAKEELAGIPIQAVVPGMTTEKWLGFWSEVDQKGFFNTQTAMMFRMSNQKELPLNYRALRIQSDGQKGCVIFLSRPEKTEKAVVDVKAQRAHLIQILDAIANPVISMDAQHKFTFLNKSACQMFATTVAEAAGKTFYDYLPQKYADILWGKAQSVLDSGRSTTCVPNRFFHKKYGNSVTLLPYFDPSSNQKRTLSIFNKTTEDAHLPAAMTAQPLDPETGSTGSPYLVALSRYMEKGAIGMYLKDTDNRIVWLNQSFAAMVGFAPEELIGKLMDEVINDPELMAALRKEDESVYATGLPLTNLWRQPLVDNKRCLRIDKIPFIDRNNKIEGIIGLAVEMDAPPMEVGALKGQLTSVSRKLEQTETSLQVLLDHREKDAALTKAKLSENIKTRVLPYLESLKQSKLHPGQLEFVDLIEENLKNFYDNNYNRLSGPEYRLSPTELKVAQLVRDGKTNKEIAKLLHLSKSTILTHRHHIRVKLGIKNKKVNLRSLLSS